MAVTFLGLSPASGETVEAETTQSNGRVFREKDRNLVDYRAGERLELPHQAHA
ncbi:MAG: hypothetical protein IIC60_02715 [Proteobacteria bacterium]|nr:hypothetical protein [Pseudomonadota bacterium]